MADLNSKKSGKPLWEHSAEMHDSSMEERDYKMKVLKKFRTPLERHIGEAMEIERRGWTGGMEWDESPQTKS